MSSLAAHSPSLWSQWQAGFLPFITSLTRLGEKREATGPILELREALGEVIALSCGLFLSGSCPQLPPGPISD